MVRACRAMAIAVQDVVELAEGDLLRDQGAGVLHPADVQRDQQALLDLQHHVDQLLLGELMGRSMGIRNYLIEGVSGAGKTAVCTELQRRGYQAIHGDRELVYRGDPETGYRRLRKGTPTATWMSEHQIWDVEKVQALVANQEEAATFSVVARGILPNLSTCLTACLSWRSTWTP